MIDTQQIYIAFVNTHTHAHSHSLDKALSMSASLPFCAILIKISCYKTANNAMAVVNSDGTMCSRHQFSTSKHKSLHPSRNPVSLIFLSRHTPLQHVPNLFSTQAHKSKKKKSPTQRRLAGFNGTAEFRCV